MTLGRVEVEGGALLEWALLCYLDADGAAPWALLACLGHELGHCLAIRALGGRVRRLRLTWAGAELRLSPAFPLPPERMIPAALAGPAANLLLAWAGAALASRGAGERLYFFTGVNLGLALFNLLPAGWLDGGRVLRESFALAGRAELGETLTCLCSEAAAALLLGLGAALLWGSGGRNFTLLLAGLWMLWWARRERAEAIS